MGSTKGQKVDASNESDCKSWSAQEINLLELPVGSVIDLKMKQQLRRARITIGAGCYEEFARTSGRSDKKVSFLHGVAFQVDPPIAVEGGYGYPGDASVISKIGVHRSIEVYRNGEDRALDLVSKVVSIRVTVPVPASIQEKQAQ